MIPDEAVSPRRELDCRLTPRSASRCSLREEVARSRASHPRGVLLSGFATALALSVDVTNPLYVYAPQSWAGDGRHSRLSYDAWWNSWRRANATCSAIPVVRLRSRSLPFSMRRPATAPCVRARGRGDPRPLQTRAANTRLTDEYVLHKPATPTDSRMPVILAYARTIAPRWRALPANADMTDRSPSEGSSPLLFVVMFACACRPYGSDCPVSPA